MDKGSHPVSVATSSVRPTPSAPLVPPASQDVLAPMAEESTPEAEATQHEAPVLVWAITVPCQNLPACRDGFHGGELAPHGAKVPRFPF